MKNQWNCSLLHRHLTQSCSEVKGRKACASKTVDKRQSYLREKKIRTYSVNYRLRLRYIKKWNFRSILSAIIFTGVHHIQRTENRFVFGASFGVFITKEFAFSCKIFVEF